MEYTFIDVVGALSATVMCGEGALQKKKTELSNIPPNTSDKCASHLELRSHDGVTKPILLNYSRGGNVGSRMKFLP